MMKKIVSAVFLFTLLLSVATAADDIEFSFLHWNDLHSQNTTWTPVNYNPENREVGGYAYLAAALDSLKSIYPEAITVHAGDDFQGTPISSITSGESQFLILNQVKPDVFVIGNHEFDYSWKRFAKLARDADFPIYGANILDSKTGSRRLKSVKSISRNDVKAAIIGLTTGELYSLTIPSNLDGIKNTDPYETAAFLVDSLKAEGYGLIIAVTHMGVDNDERLAREVPDIDLIIGGHSHTYMSSPRKEGDTYIVQASSRGRYIGETHIITDGEKIKSIRFKPVEVRPSELSPRRDIAQLVDSLENAAGDELNREIGQLKTDWVRGGHESNIGNWMTDAIRRYTGAHIAFQNNGGIRKNLHAGPITVRDMWEIAPFSNQITLFEVSGKEIETIVEFQVADHHSLQRSGLTYTVTETGQITDIRINGKKLRNRKTYQLATNNYVAGHFDKYFGIPARDVSVTDYIDRDLFIRAVTEEKIIDSKIEGRVALR